MNPGKAFPVPESLETRIGDLPLTEIRCIANFRMANNSKV